MILAGRVSDSNWYCSAVAGAASRDSENLNFNFGFIEILFSSRTHRSTRGVAFRCAMTALGRLREFNAVNSGHWPGGAGLRSTHAPATSAAPQIAVARASPGNRPDGRLESAERAFAG